jgi:DNA-binding transcriptional MocR family regulator
MDAGLHAFLELAPGLDELRLAEEARERGVRVSPLRPFYLGEPDRSGWLLAYGGLGVEEVWWGARVLARLLLEAVREPRAAGGRL